jgi:glycosyltransferase involved in cell wall biosynthesis
VHDLDRLMVIIPDRLSDLVRKGEITDRYYNPGNLFSEVHIVMTNDDRPDIAAIQPTVGSAKLFLHNLPAGMELLVSTLGWRPWLLKGWANKAVALAEEIKPSLIRCHGARLNAFAARAIKRRLGVPYVVSLHINPDVDVRRGPLRTALMGYAAASVEKESLLEADLVLPVYRPIEPFLRRLGVKHYRVAYNVINPNHLGKKDNYALHRPVRVISVGRLIAAKDPRELIAAVAGLPEVELTVVGDGPVAEASRRLAAELGVDSRIIFRPSIRNDELCAALPHYDIFAIRSDYFELSKSMLEALLTGLPVIINRRAGEPVPELSSEICLLVENAAESYRSALQKLIANDAFRERLGRDAYGHAQANWSPERSEAVFVEVYRNLLAARRNIDSRQSAA